MCTVLEVNNQDKNKWTGTFQIFTIGILPLAHLKVYPGKFARNIDLHMGEGLFCFQNDGNKPCSAIWKRNERANDLLPVWEQVS